MFKLEEKIHGRKIDAVKKKENVTKSALASLRLAIKAYFKTYDVATENGIVHDMSVKEGEVFFDYCMERVGDLCNNVNYQEVYMQCIFHFHHFFELLLKDILSSVDPKLVLKVKLDGDDSVEIMNIFQNKKSDITELYTAEFMTSMKRVISLLKLKDGFIPIVAKTIQDNKQTLVDLNKLRNRAWHKGLYSLKITELDQFISQNILPLVMICLSQTNYNKLESYWKYRDSSFDPILEIIKSGQESDVNYKRIAFFKAYGSACYNVPDWNIDLDLVEKKAAAIVDTIFDIKVETCFVCNYEALLVTTETDFSSDLEGNNVSFWTNSTAAECLCCSLKIFPDIGEPNEHGINSEKLWESMQI